MNRSHNPDTRTRIETAARAARIGSWLAVWLLFPAVAGAVVIPAPGVGGLEFRLTASDLNGDGVDNNPFLGSMVDSWVDTVGGLNFEQSLQNQQPFLSFSGPFSTPSVFFTGSFLSETDLGGASFLANSTGTIIQVYTNTNDGEGYGLFTVGENGQGPSTVVLNSGFNPPSGNGSFGIQTGTPANDLISGGPPRANTGDFRWSAVTGDGSEWTFYTNALGPLQVNTRIGSNSGSWFDAAGAYQFLGLGGFIRDAPDGIPVFTGESAWDGDISEFLIFDHVLTEQELATIDQWIDSNYCPSCDIDAPTDFAWNTDPGLGSWTDASSWLDTDTSKPAIAAPDSSNATATLGAAITMETAVAVTANVTVKSLILDNANSYVFGGTGTVNLESADGNAELDVQQGSHVFQNRVSLGSDTDVSLAAGTQLDLNNELSLGGNDLNVSGNGQLNINHLINSGGGTVNNAGNLSGGSGGGISGDLVSTGTLSIDIGSSEFTSLSIGGTATLSGLLDIDLVDGFAPAVGDTFDVLTARHIQLEGLNLSGDVAGFSMALFEADTILRLTIAAAVPEPSSVLMLLMLGAVAVCRPRWIMVLRGRGLTAVLLALLLVPSVAQAQVIPAPSVTGLSFRLTASDLNGDGVANNPADGNAVASWVDTVGGLDFEQADSGFQPLLSSTTVSSPTGDITAPTVAFTSHYLFETDLGSASFLADGAGTIVQVYTAAPDHNEGYSLFPVGDNGQGPSVVVLNSNFVPPEANGGFGVQTTTTANNLIDGYVPGGDPPGVNDNGLHWSAITGDSSTWTFHTDGLGPLPEGVRIGTNTGEWFNANTTYEFLGLGGFAPGNSFTGVSPWLGNISELLIYDHVLTAAELSNVGAWKVANYGGTIPPPIVDFTWKATGGFGDWNDGGSWDKFGLPNANTDMATFGAEITEPTNVAVVSDVTVKAITFDSANPYVLFGTATVRLEADAGNAAISVVSGSHEFQSRVALGSTTDVIAAAGGSVDFNNEIALDGNDLNISGEGQANINNSVDSGGGTVNNTGTLGGAGENSISGDLVSTGTLDIDLGGLGASEFDSFLIGGTATLSGLLDIELINGFAPTAGDTFDVVTANSIDATGLTLSGEAGFDFEIVTGSDILRLTFGGGTPGDFDKDGVVDGEDFLIWQANFGTASGATQAMGDANEDGAVDGEDFLLWQANFGTGTGGNGSAAVPEPGTLLLLACGILALCFKAKRRLA